MVNRSKDAIESHALHGWRQIADYLGQSVSVAQRWAKIRNASQA
jgi:hypothetical protein